MTPICVYCGTADELRPYGPGGSWTCFDCMKATPERETAAEGAFYALLGASVAMSPQEAAVLTPQGPQPLIGGEQLFPPKEGDGHG